LALLLMMGLCVGTLAGAAHGALLPGHGAARDAVEGFLARHGVAADARGLDALSGRADLALADVVRSFEGVELAAARAYGHADLGLAQAWAGGAAPLPSTPAEAWRATGFDPAPVLAARERLVQSALAFRAAAQAGLPPVQLHAAPALALDLEGVDNVYTVDTALTIDAGGNDVYLNNGGGSNLLNGCIGTVLGPGAGGAVDLAGNDRYGSGRGCGINGGASVGVGFLLDGAGDDVYASDEDSGNKGVNGGGAVLGLGFLRDLGGNDVYTSGGWGTNGGGWVGGMGMLLDEAGDDSYRATDDGVNGGGSLGVGLLLDAAGHDLYEEECQFQCHVAWDETVVPKQLAGAQLDQ
jgi:hypothetical protein